MFLANNLKDSRSPHPDATLLGLNMFVIRNEGKSGRYIRMPSWIIIDNDEHKLPKIKLKSTHIRQKISSQGYSPRLFSSSSLQNRLDSIIEMVTIIEISISSQSPPRLSPVSS
jgi:hypothetical protein